MSRGGGGELGPLMVKVSCEDDMLELKRGIEGDSGVFDVAC